MEEDADVENNAALLNSKSHETKGKRVTTSLAGLTTALVAGIFGGEPPFPSDVQWHLYSGLTFTISSRQMYPLTGQCLAVACKQC